MGNPYINDAGTFLISTVFGIYILIVMLRLVFQWVRADFYNPISQFIVRATQAPLKLLRRVTPSIGRLDTAALAFALLLQMIELYIVLKIGGRPTGPAGIFVVACSQLVSLTLNIFFFAIFIQVIISWISPGAYNPIMGLLYSLTEPILRRARGMLPAMAGLDWSPMVVLIALQLGQFLLVAPIRDVGHRLLLM